MEEVEVSVEHQHEAVHHHAEHSDEKWLLYSALISSCLAVAAAICGLHASHSANNAMLSQMHATDHWGYYQAKGIKASIAEMRADLLEADKYPGPQALTDKLDRYKKEQQEIKDEATSEESKSQFFMEKYEILAEAVTSFQVAITITAISAITRRKHFLLLTFALAIIGLYFMALAFSN